uniref:RRM domain-containing protein n=1 Tax=Panagrellus redivivus TaxID=6233 RepID=A0A7E4V4W7_PANRE
MNRFGASRPGPAPSEKALRSVFVGNIGYDVSEQELTDIFSQVGHVVSFRLVHDRESGKSKGFGFCEYHDPETANECVRRMNHFELKGRNLRLDSAVANERMMHNDDPPPYRPQKPVSMPRGRSPPLESLYAPAPLDGKIPEAIAKALSHHSPHLLFEIITEMKQIATTNEARCRAILDKNPQLAFALLQAQVMMHWMDTDVAFRLLDKNMNSEKMAEQAEKSAREDANHGHDHEDPHGRREEVPHSRPPLARAPEPVPQPSGPPPQAFYNQGPPPPQAYRHPQQVPMPRPPVNWNPHAPPQQQQQRFGGPPPNYGNNFDNGPPPPQRYQNQPDPMQNAYGSGPPRSFNPQPMRGNNFGQFPPPQQQQQQFRPPPQAVRMPMMGGPPPGMAPPPQAETSEDDEMLQMLLNLTDEQLNGLDPEEAAKVRDLKLQMNIH